MKLITNVLDVTMSLQRGIITATDVKKNIRVQVNGNYSFTDLSNGFDYVDNIVGIDWTIKLRLKEEILEQ